VSFRPYEQSESVPEPPPTKKFFTRSNWRAVAALVVVIVLVSLVLNALVYTQPWSKVTLRIYNNLEEAVVISLYEDGRPMNHAVEIGPNHTAFSDGHGIFSPMGGFPANITLKATPGTHEFGITVSRFNGTAFVGDDVVDASRSVSVGYLSSRSVVLAIT
jgi:hypothetical protein